MYRAEYRKEALSYSLRSARAPRDDSPLAGVVLVVDEYGKGFAYISFTEAFERAVGMALARGISWEDRAYIKVLHSVKREMWMVYAYYTHSAEGVLLWRTKEKPSWIKRIRRPKAYEKNISQ